MTIIGGNLRTVRRLAAICAGLLLLTNAANGWSADESNRTISTVGASLNNLGFIIIAEGVNANCVYGTLYMDISAAPGRAMMATALSARALGAKVRVVYTPPATPGVCTLDLISLN